MREIYYKKKKVANRFRGWGSGTNDIKNICYINLFSFSFSFFFLKKKGEKLWRVDNTFSKIISKTKIFK